MSHLNSKKIVEQPRRMQYAIDKFTELGFEIEVNNTTICFNFSGNLIKLFPYTGWHTGKGIKYGRGLNNLLKQLKY